MFFHFLDLAVANSSLEYCNFELEDGTPKSKISDLLALQNEVGHALAMATAQARSADRPRSELHSARSLASPPQKRSKKIIMPLQNVQ